MATPENTHNFQRDLILHESKFTKLNCKSGNLELKVMASFWNYKIKFLQKAWSSKSYKKESVQTLILTLCHAIIHHTYSNPSLNV